MNGVGFVFTSSDPYVGVDLDDVYRDGILSDGAAGIVNALNSNTQRSVGGLGAHVIVEAELPASGRGRGNIEVYAEGRHFAMTGCVLQGQATAINLRQEQLDALHARLFGPLSNPTADARNATRVGSSSATHKEAS